jgi:hypothetical protein
LSATCVFAISAGLGSLGVELPRPVRVVLLLAVCLSATSVDLWAYANPQRGGGLVWGLSRQTPRALMYKGFPLEFVSLMWGLDTGLAFTTFRVTGLTWVLFVAALLGFTPWWLGLVYGLSFGLPLCVTCMRNRATRPESCTMSVASTGKSRRRLLHLASAVLLLGLGSTVWVA